MKTKLMVFGLLMIAGQTFFAAELPSAKDDSAATGGIFSLFPQEIPAKEKDISLSVKGVQGARLFVDALLITVGGTLYIAPFLKRDCKDIAPYVAALAIPFWIYNCMTKPIYQCDVDTVKCIKTFDAKIWIRTFDPKTSISTFDPNTSISTSWKYFCKMMQEE